jgi:DNA-directed RNA polymerase specialized sigma24 family protein
MSYDEIAAELKIPLSDVKSNLFRARKLLAEKLK